ncbi:restriction endonuclease subunit S [uncultured Chryseobacterium sp.]|uniref:restriction endonuclease subunit S n=1 Tax=uncultured Chryseobacterium sp. TaxID=259322 RepID=UPI002624C757|nr:restriction endonuclease subunit S [uncultured Chryseobacterium sp.]
MSRGRKITINSEIDKSQKLFFENVGFYMSIINKELGKKYSPEPLANFIKIAGGFAFKTSSYKKSGIPIIRISDFNNERIDLSSCVFYDEDASLQKFLLEEGDIIICLTGGTIAKLGIVQGGLGKIYLNQRVGKFEVLDENIFEKEYVYWLAKSVANTIKNLAWGAAIPNVSPKQIEKIKVSIPPKDIQIGIISFLNDLKNEDFKREFYFDPEIEKHILDLHESSKTTNILSYELTHQLSLISQLRQAFLREAMQGTLVSNETSDGKTGADLLAEIKAEKEQLLKDKKIKKGKQLPPISEGEIPFDIPEELSFIRLGEIFKVEKGKIGIQKAEKSGSIPLVVTSEERQSHNEIHFDGPSVIIPLVSSTGHGHASMKRIHYQEGSFAVGNILGCIQTYLPAFFNMKFLFHYLDTYKQTFFVEKMKGAANVSLKLSSIEETPIPLIRKEIQDKYEELILHLENLEASVKESQNYNAQLLQQVLREALEGKN